MCTFKIIILIHTKYIKNTEHHYRWNMHMNINKCMHDTFHGRLSEFAQAYNTATPNSRSLEMIVFQEFGKYCHFLPGSCVGVDKRH